MILEMNAAKKTFENLYVEMNFFQLNKNTAQIHSRNQKGQNNGLTLTAWWGIAAVHRLQLLAVASAQLIQFRDEKRRLSHSERSLSGTGEILRLIVRDAAVVVWASDVDLTAGVGFIGGLKICGEVKKKNQN